jgi:DNA repair protein RadC
MRLSPSDRPREKLVRLGAAGLGDNELIAAVLGQGGRGSNALELAAAILDRSGGPGGLPRIGIEDLRQLRGVGVARAAQIIAAVELGRRTLSAPAARRRFRRPCDVADWLLPQYGGKPVEQFGVVLLDARRGLLATRIVSTGSADASSADPREVFRDAIVARAAAVVLFHNHPTGDPTPSRDDVAVTRRLVAAATVIGIDVMDHVILGTDTYFSFHEHGGREWKA